MAIKSVTIFIDQFSDRIFDLGHNDIHLYDFGYFTETVWIDNLINVYNGEYSGYFSYDDYYTSVTDNVGTFYKVSPDNDASIYPGFTTATTNAWDYDLKGSGSFVDVLGNVAYFDEYYTLIRADQTDASSANHGDWTLAAYLDELDDPDQNTIICIDVDTLNGASSHYSKLFDSKLSVNSWLAGELNYVTGIEAILESFLTYNDKRITGNSNDDEFTISCLSVSIAGAPATQELSTLSMFAALDIPIVQAAPNVGQGDYDWGSNYADVINVGAWNVDNEDELLLSSVNTLSTLDILGNGQVFKSDWGSGSNFGTSFATPKVAADITNLYNNLIDNLETQGISLGEAQAQSQALDVDYSDIVNFLVDEISTPLFVTLDEAGTQGSSFLKVRTTDVVASPLPTKVTSTSGGLTGLTVTSARTNDAPSVSSSAISNSAEGSAYVYTFTATDSDAGDVLTLSAETLPSWLSFDAATGVLSGTPTNTNVGSHAVVLRATDATGAYSEQSFTITVNNTNVAPTVSSTAIASVAEDSAYSYTFTAADVDGDTLTLSSVTLPSWLSFDASTGVLSGTPTNDDVGEHDVTLRVNDGTVNVDQSFKVTVTNTNDAPTITTTTSLTTNEDTALTDIGFSGSDVDAGDTLTFTFSDPAKGSVVDNGDDTFTYTPDANAFGSDSFAITVNDGTVNVTETVNVAISGVQDAPTITSTALTSIDEDSAYSYTVAASDVDGDTLTLSSVVLPSWLSFDASSGVLSGTPTNDDVGEHDVTLRVNDGAVDVDQAFKVTVSNTNDAAVGTVSISGDYTVKETLSLETTNITDQDGLGTFSYKWFRDGSVIQSAKQAQYTLKNSDIGAIISAEVSFIDGFGTQEIISATAPKKVTPKVASSDDVITGTASADTIYAGEGADLVSAGAGSDTIELWSSSAYHYGYYARNIETGSRVSIRYKTKYSSVIDGEADADTIILMDSSNGDAFFLHDAYSDLHESVSTTVDDKGMQTAARVISIETILAGDGDDIIDLTSDTFDMGGTNITLKGEAGDDVLWAAEGNDTLDGGSGDDTLFGGYGNDILTGGDGADVFEFVNSTAAQTDTITDYSSDDTLKFYLGDGDSQVTQADYQNGTLKWGNLTIAFEDRIGTGSDNDINDLSIVYV